MPTNKELLIILLDKLSEYHPDIAPSKDDTTEELLEKYFYWVDEYNDGYSNELANPNASRFNKWIASERRNYNG